MGEAGETTSDRFRFSRRVASAVAESTDSYSQPSSRCRLSTSRTSSPGCKSIARYSQIAFAGCKYIGTQAAGQGGNEAGFQSAPGLQIEQGNCTFRCVLDKNVGTPWANRTSH